MPPKRLGAAFLGAGLAVFAIAACAQAAPPGDMKTSPAFPYAFAKRGCTQEDAPALEIYLTQVSFEGKGEPSPPFIRFEISALPGETVAPATLKLIQLRRDPAKPGRIARAQFTEQGYDILWLSGTITLNEASQGQRASGRYDVATADGRRWSGNFVASFSDRGAVCG